MIDSQKTISLLPSMPNLNSIGLEAMLDIWITALKRIKQKEINGRKAQKEKE
ncbi:hypothetical protein [Aristophania vespae]|uniref:hypothetical protein n=1 Tax=Aristophania vespae TaxID=2697033 RepID=UPI0023518AB9|nr:hypothetical protein [Aristophania vespae]